MATERGSGLRAAVAALALMAVPWAALAQAPLGPVATGVDASEALPASIGRAYDVAMSRISESLSDEQIGTLQMIAHATAAASLCPTLNLDEPAIYGALAAVTHEVADDMTAAEQERHRDFAMIAYGALSALRLVEAADDEATFCSEAAAYAADPEEQTFLVVGETPEVVGDPAGSAPAPDQPAEN